MFSLLSVFLFIQSNQVLVWFSCQFVCVFSCGKPSIVDRQDSSFPLKLAYFIIFLCWHFLFHLCSFPDFVRFLHHPCQFLGFLAHRIHGAAIYDNIYHQYTPVMLAFFYQHHGSVMGCGLQLVPIAAVAAVTPAGWWRSLWRAAHRNRGLRKPRRLEVVPKPRIIPRIEEIIAVIACRNSFFKWVI